MTKFQAQREVGPGLLVPSLSRACFKSSRPETRSQMEKETQVSLNDRLQSFLRETQWQTICYLGKTGVAPHFFPAFSLFLHLCFSLSVRPLPVTVQAASSFAPLSQLICLCPSLLSSMLRTISQHRSKFINVLDWMGPADSFSNESGAQGGQEDAATCC